MAEQIVIPVSADKKERYEALLPQLNALVEGEKDFIANLANIVAALRQAMNFFWVGVYLVKRINNSSDVMVSEVEPRHPHDHSLVLGPFQGPVACTRIAYGKGVCGTSWKKAETIIVENVDEFPGHISCSAGSKSEIVIPFFKSPVTLSEGEGLNPKLQTPNPKPETRNQLVAGVLDVDSDQLSDFDETDSHYLNMVARLIETLHEQGK